MRPEASSLTGQDPKEVPMSLQRIASSVHSAKRTWIGPKEAAPLADDEQKAYDLAHQIQIHLCTEAPLKHASGHPGGPLSAFTFAYLLSKKRDPAVDQPLRMSPGHLSLLSYGLQWMFGRSGNDERLKTPQSIIDTFRTPSGLPGHIEAGIGDIPLGTGPLGKGVSNGLGVAFGLKHQGKPGMVDVLLADGDSQEGQVMEAFRLAAHLKLDNLVVHGDWNDIQLSGLPSEVVATDFAALAHASGWNVIEVQNGNDPAQVISALEKADEYTSSGAPTFICYYTVMGYGVDAMEEGSNTGKENFHGKPLGEELAAEIRKKLPSLKELTAAYEPFRAAEQKRYTAKERTQTDIPLVFDATKTKRSITAEKGAARKDFAATHLHSIMKHDERIVVLHADLAGSGGFDKVEKEFPNRVINVGVAEANMYMMAAGMRQTGLLPVTYTFAAFGTNEARANARLIDINCEHTRCGVIHDCTHSGLSVGEDGETHQERNYLNIPLDNTEVWMPADSNQAGAMAEKALEKIAEGHKSVYVFTPRSSHPQVVDDDATPFFGESYEFTGKADTLFGLNNATDQLTIISSGITVHSALEAAKLLMHEEQPVQARVLNIGCIRPIDASAIIKAALETLHLVVVEDHHSEGGLASQVADVIADFQLPCSLRRLGANHYFPSATDKDLRLMAGIDAESVLDAALDEVRTEVCGGEDALMTALHTLAHNSMHSRFRAQVQDFINMVQNKDYLSKLRETWKSRACPPEKLPSNEDLLKMFSLASEQGIDLG